MDKARNISGWGNYPVQKRSLVYSTTEELSSDVVIRGNGRSYGDQAIGDHILSTLNLNQVIELDKTSSILTIDSGFLLRNVLNYIIPLGYNIATIPGTQFVTIGGMIAADVHGKNHFKHGSIGNWIDELYIQVSEQESVWCSSTKNSELFNATVGGMGLTGIILRAKIRLIPISGSSFQQKTSTASSIEELIKLFENCQDDYQVAWLDLLNTQHKYLLFSGNESNQNNTSSFKLKQPKLTVPKLPFKLLTSFLMKAYNQLYYKNNCNSAEKVVDFNEFFFPLDKFNNWNNLYGKKGMIQYQFILPQEMASKGFNEIIHLIEKSTHKPYLSVLKKYGENTSPGLLSFPLKGFSMALDFPIKTNLTVFLNELDKIVIQYNGRIYLAKDACLQPKSMVKMYPNLANFKSIISKHKYSSNLATRLKIK